MKGNCKDSRLVSWIPNAGSWEEPCWILSLELCRLFLCSSLHGFHSPRPIFFPKSPYSLCLVLDYSGWNFSQTLIFSYRNRLNANTRVSKQGSVPISVQSAVVSTGSGHPNSALQQEESLLLKPGSGSKPPDVFCKSPFLLVSIFINNLPDD